MVNDRKRKKILEEVFERVIETVGEDIKRDGLRKTPKRVAKSILELTEGYSISPYSVINGAIFDQDNKDDNEIVLIKDIEYFSLCEHHILPFFGSCHVAYIPNGKIIGLSKIPRIVNVFAKRLQVQERLTSQIADFIEEVLSPRGVAVMMEGFHLCVASRGIEKTKSKMSTTSFRGVFSHHKMKREFFELISKDR